jgi:hypothetical protein
VLKKLPQVRARRAILPDSEKPQQPVRSPSRSDRQVVLIIQDLGFEMERRIVALLQGSSERLHVVHHGVTMANVLILADIEVDRCR